MAIYHCSLKPVSRAIGRSAVGAAAYRSGAVLTNERDGEIHDFSRRGGVEHTEIILPSGVAADWAKDRSVLWNAAEKAEPRKDSRVAQEIEIALPHELTGEQQIELTREFAEHLAERYGAAVDAAIHTPHEGRGRFQGKDIRNVHAHLLMSVRQVEEAGFGEKIELEQENKKLKQAGLATGPQQVREIRVAWENFANRALARADHDIRIDHRSHHDRGLEFEPTQHVGVHATAVKRKGKVAERKRLTPEAEKSNVAILNKYPNKVLQIITDEKSVFTKQDIARTIGRYIDNPQDYQNALAKVMASTDLVELKAETRDTAGRVSEEARYSTEGLVKIEQDMARRADNMAARRIHAVHQQRVKNAIEWKEHKERAKGKKTFTLKAEQRRAVQHVTGAESIAAIVGKAGTGKSTLLDAARDAWERQGYTVHGAALAGKAAEGLQQSAGIESRTLAAWELAWSTGRHQLGSRDIFVIDEAGMVGSKQLARFVKEVERAGAKLVLVGDHEQVQAIEAGAPFRAVAERVGFRALEEVNRQREEWQREASKAFGQEDTDKGLTAYAEHGDIRFEASRGAARQAIMRDVLADMDTRPDGSRLVLAYTRADVRDLNEAIRVARQGRGELTDENHYYTNEGKRQFARNDRVVFLENDSKLKVKNGMLGTVMESSTGRLMVRLDTDDGPATGRFVEVNQARYKAIDHGYATTIHKSQGATVDRSYVLASGLMDRHLAYVAMTRHRHGATMYAGRDDFNDMADLTTTLSRSGLKESTLDYHDFAERRGFNGEYVMARLVERGQLVLNALGKRLDMAMEQVRERLGLPAAAHKEPEPQFVPRSAAPARESQGERVYLKVPYTQKDKAKQAGAKWDAEHGQWYAPPGSDLEAFKRWRGNVAERAPGGPALTPEQAAKEALRQQVQGMSGLHLSDLARSLPLTLEEAAQRVSPAYAKAAQRAEQAAAAVKENGKAIAHYVAARDHHAKAGLKRWNEMGVVKQLKHRAGVLDEALRLDEAMEKAMARQVEDHEKTAPGLATALENAEKNAVTELERARPAAEKEQERHKERVEIAKEVEQERYDRAKSDRQQRRANERGQNGQSDGTNSEEGERYELGR